VLRPAAVPACRGVRSLDSLDSRRCVPRVSLRALRPARALRPLLAVYNTVVDRPKANARF